MTTHDSPTDGWAQITNPHQRVMRQHLADIEWGDKTAEDFMDPRVVTDAEVRNAIRRDYAGGLDQFWTDSAVELEKAEAEDAARTAERLAEADATDFENLESETEALAAMSPQEAEAAGYLPGVADPVRATWLHPASAYDLAQAHYEATAEDEWRQVTGRPPTGHLAVGSHTSPYAPRIEEGQTFGWKPTDAAEPGTPFGGWIYPRSVAAREFNAANRGLEPHLHTHNAVLNRGAAEDAALSDQLLAEAGATLDDDAAVAYGIPGAWVPDPDARTDTHAWEASRAQVTEVLDAFEAEHPTANLYDLQVYTPAEPDGVYDDSWAEGTGS